MDDPAAKPKSHPPPSPSRRRPVEFALRHRGRDIPLAKEEILIGRSSECDVVLDSTLVSRRHARITIGDAVLLEDLDSRNGVLVNTKQIGGRVRIRIGDVISFGDQALELIAAPPPSEPLPRDRLRSSPTLTNTAATDRPEGENTRSATALELLAGVVDKALALGHGDEAERMLQLHLVRLLEQTQNGLPPPPESASLAAHYAVKLAAVTGKPRWLDYPIELYSALGKPLPLTTIDDLYALLRKPTGIDLALLRSYVKALRERAAALGPADRFALQRIEGLERLASL